MKALLTGVLVVLCSISYGQFTVDSLPVNKETGLVDFTEVINVDSVPAKKLYSNAKIFIAKAFVSGKHVTQLNDDESSTIVGHGKVELTANNGIFKQPGGWFDFTITIRCKDGRYKYSITDFRHEGYPAVGYKWTAADQGPIENIKPQDKQFPPKQWLDYKRQAYIAILPLIADLKKFMNATALDTKDNF